jgi:hypothetical protein
VAESDEEILTLDVSDDALERAAPVVGGQATVTLGVWYCHRGQLRLGPAHFSTLPQSGISPCCRASVQRVLVAIESHQLDLILSAQTKTMLVPISNALSC